MPIFMKFEGIEGESKHPRHKREIELSSFQWGTGRGITVSTSGSTGVEGSVPSVNEIVVTKKADKASPMLFRESLGGTGRKVTITFEQEKPDHSLQVFLVIQLENTLISGYGVAGGGDIPTKSLSLNFTKITFTPPGLTGSFLLSLARIIREAL